MKFNFLHENVVKQIEENNFEDAISLIDELYTNQGSWFLKLFSEKQDDKKKGKFAYTTFRNIIHSNLDFNSEEALKKLNLLEDYIFEVVELSQFLLRIEDSKKISGIETKLSSFLKLIFNKLTLHIKENSNNYPTNSINGKIWMDGAAIREWCQEIANYFGRKKEADYEIEMCFYKCKVTTSIMGHYPEEVGPDMISIASKLENKADLKNAAIYYKPVIADFQLFLETLEGDINDDEFKIEQREVNILDSLIKAVEGLSRIGGYIDEDNLVQRSRMILKKKVV